jgi:hypothetical protein
MSEWISGSEARRILGLSNTALLRLAVLGHVKTHVAPGVAVRYRRADIERVAEEQNKLEAVAC